MWRCPTTPKPRPPAPPNLQPSRRALLGWTSLAGAGLALGSVSAAGAAVPGTSFGAAPTATGGAATNPGPGLTPFPQQDDLNFETLFNYGESAYGAGEVGEVASTVALVHADIRAAGAAALPAYQPYVNRFEALAARLAEEAREDLAAGRRLTARGKFLRSAGYYNSVLFFILGTATPEREPEIYRLMQTQWAAAAELLTPRFERVEIRAEVRLPTAPGSTETVTRTITMPAYYAAAPGAGRKPTVIVNNGSDAQFIDVYAYGGAAGLERGYNVLLFEGPGQGALLFEQGIPFTPYWQDVVSPLVDYLEARPDVDPRRIGLTGWSFGGLLVMRAAAYEPRLAAVVGDPGFASASVQYAKLIAGLRVYGGINDAALEKLLASGPERAQPDGRLALSFLLRKRGEIYVPSWRAAALRAAPLTGIAGLLTAMASYDADPALLARVRAHVLLTSYELDTFVTEAADDETRTRFTGAASVAQRRFTVAEGAEYHCAPMAPQTRNEVVFDWFDRVMAGAAPAPAPASTGGSNALPLGIVGGAAVVVAGAVAIDAVHRRSAAGPAEPDRPAGPPLPGPRQGVGDDERSTADA